MKENWYAVLAVSLSFGIINQSINQSIARTRSDLLYIAVKPRLRTLGSQVPSKECVLSSVTRSACSAASWSNSSRVSKPILNFHIRWWPMPVS